MSRHRKSRHGFLKFLTVIIILGLIVLILYFTGVFNLVGKEINERIYPLDFEEEILEASEEYGLSPQLISAVIHTESKFKAKAESAVGAKGLMQLMPETFDWLIGLRGTEHTQEDILTPAVNIDYGCYYISWLDDRLPGDVYTAVAAYNAGMGHVEDWLENPDFSIDGENLHEIPFEETKNYVDRIKEAEEMYAKLYFCK